MFRPFQVAVTAAALLLSIPLLAETHYPLTVFDDLDNKITLTKAPQKVSSKTLFTDEVLTSILSPQRLSSLTNYAADPGYSNITNQLPKAVPLLDFNAEKILSNNPDLVFAADWSDSGTIEQLRRVGVTVYLIDTPTRWQDIQAEILKIGQILNVEAQAEQLLHERNLQLQALSSQREEIKQHRLVALDYNTWGTASGVDTTWNTVLEQAGLINGSAQFEQGRFGQVAMSKELIVTINPDVLFLPGWVGDHSDGEAFYHQLLDDPALSNVKAVHNGRVYAVPEKLRGTYSQYMVDAISFVINAVAADL
jgi:iron complex transport system substrate-binding protein